MKSPSILEIKMPPIYESVTLLPAEAQFIESTIRAFSQNRAVGGETDQGAVVDITKTEIQKSLDILAKVRAHIQSQFQVPISFTQDEARLMQYLYNNYLQGHGKPQGDLDWTYYIRFDDNAQQLIINVMRKVGCNVSNLPPSTYPQGYNPFPRL
jgi:hypothetical protein